MSEAAEREKVGKQEKDKAEKDRKTHQKRGSTDKGVREEKWGNGSLSDRLDRGDPFLFLSWLKTTQVSFWTC